MIRLISIFSVLVIFAIACGKESPATRDILQLLSAKIGQLSLLENNVVPKDDIILIFGASLNTSSASSAITIKNASGQVQNLDFDFLDQNKIIVLKPKNDFVEDETYTLIISDKLTGVNGETSSWFNFTFKILKSNFEITDVKADEKLLILTGKNLDLPSMPIFTFTTSHQVESSSLQSSTFLVGAKNYSIKVEQISPKNYKITTLEKLPSLSKINLLFSSTLSSSIGRPFKDISYTLFTQIDPTPKFPKITDEELLDKVTAQTFKYFWDFGHPVSGLARERNTSGDIVTTGGSGFGLMAMIVAVKRGIITRSQAIQRWSKIFNFLEKADRFHGVWPHWMNGSTGKVQPFSQKDNGGDLVETGFLIQGMITVRQYLDPKVSEEKELIDQINKLWLGVEWSWYTKGQNQLYWHWSPQYNWDLNLKIRGHNETQIAYVLAAASTTFGINKSAYTIGYANNGGMINNKLFYNIRLPIGFDYGGPLFFTHYSYLGLDPRKLNDGYANYWEQNVNHTLINRAYCIANPGKYLGYSKDCWGLTASDNNGGYSAHSPTNDRGVISPTAALSSFPYTPKESMDALHFFYYTLGDKLWGQYGFYDAFNLGEGWVASSFLAIDQGPIICMIENHRSGLLWDLFMSAPEIKAGLQKLDIKY